MLMMHPQRPFFKVSLGKVFALQIIRINKQLGGFRYNMIPVHERQLFDQPVFVQFLRVHERVRKINTVKGIFDQVFKP